MALTAAQRKERNREYKRASRFRAKLRAELDELHRQRDAAAEAVRVAAAASHARTKPSAPLPKPPSSAAPVSPGADGGSGAGGPVPGVQRTKATVDLPSIPTFEPPPTIEAKHTTGTAPPPAPSATPEEIEEAQAMGAALAGWVAIGYEIACSADLVPQAGRDMLSKHLPRVMAFVSGAGTRCALKWGVGLPPYADEVTVAAAIVVPGLAIRQAYRLGKLDDVKIFGFGAGAATTDAKAAPTEEPAAPAAEDSRPPTAQDFNPEGPWASVRPS